MLCFQRWSVANVPTVIANVTDDVIADIMDNVIE